MIEDDDEPMRWAERVVERARPHVRIDGVEAFVERHRFVASTIERNSPTIVHSTETLGVGVRVRSRGRTGFAYVTRYNDLDRAIEEAEKASALSKPLKMDFPRAHTYPTVARIWDPRIDALHAEDAMQMATEMIDAVEDRRKDLNVAGGGVTAGAVEYAVANSEGLHYGSRGTGISAFAYVVQSKGALSTGTSERRSTRLDVKADVVGREAADLAIASSKAKKLEDPKIDGVIIRPEAAADLIGTISVPSLSGRAVHRQESYYTGKLGQKIASARLSLIEDPLEAGGLGSAPSDDEGVPSRRIPLITRGVLKRFLYDTATAAEYGAKTTASAVRMGGIDGRSFKSPPTVSSRQVRVEAPSTTTARLIAGIDHGVLVHDLMGVHTANVVSGDFGATSTLLFEIRKGAIEGPLSPVSVSGNLHRALEMGLRLGNDTKEVQAGAGFRLPSVAFSGLTVTP